ncbi:hypothetical protein EXIGLDRAFT_847084 [Exidia glandulosa HHB12029]|uniref:Uncharacterized protein n=1 Tax=Exidia glandulosa HHB12029 TaxID=1314781 RepID=A0A165Z2T8_EXIGL|nr:hypothetical protein EXIGLDRAFT_847084 [Exidia glandulosa HHB12029]
MSIAPGTSGAAQVEAGSDHTIVQNATARLNAENAPLSSQSSIPWTAGCRLGDGVDALTGAIRGRAVADFAVEFPTGPVTPGDGVPSTVYTTLHLCHSSNSTATAFSKALCANVQMRVSDSVPIPPLSAGVGFSRSALETVQHSSDIFSLLVRTDFIISPEGLHRGRYQLTSAAREALETGSIEDFGRRFGEYFISGYQRATRYEAVLVFRCTSSSSRSAALESLRAHFGVDTTNPAVALVDGARDVQRMSQLFASEDDVRMHTFSEHVSAKAMASAATPASVKALLGDWKSLCDAALPQPVIAILLPLYRVAGIAESKLPTYLDIALSRFSSLAKLRELVDHCTLVSSTLRTSTPALTALRSDLDRLSGSNVSALHSTESDLDPLISRAMTLKQHFDSIAELYDFYFVLVKLRTEAFQPDPPSSILRDYGRQQAISALKVECLPVPVAASKRLLALPWKRSIHSFRVPQANQYASSRVIGLRLRWGGRGRWLPLTPTILDGLEQLGISFSSGTLSKEQWDVEIFYVRDETLDALARTL